MRERERKRERKRDNSPWINVFQMGREMRGGGVLVGKAWPHSGARINLLHLRPLHLPHLSLRHAHAPSRPRALPLRQLAAAGRCSAPSEKPRSLSASAETPSKSRLAGSPLLRQPRQETAAISHFLNSLSYTRTTHTLLHTECRITSASAALRSDMRGVHTERVQVP